MSTDDEIVSFEAEIDRLREIINGQKAKVREVSQLIRRTKAAEHRADWFERRKDAAEAALARVTTVIERIEAAKPHIPPSTDPKRREAVVERATLNRVSRWVRAAVGTTAPLSD